VYRRAKGWRAEQVESGDIWLDGLPMKPSLDEIDVDPP
jgi:hypothetical protein